MEESGNRSPVRISQKRLSIVLAVLGLLGCILLGIVWWDSVENITAYSNQKRSIFIGDSAVGSYESHILSLGAQVGYWREERVMDDYFISDPPLFPLPVASSNFISIPIYLLILTYLATLLLIWIVLMNRLARRDFTKAVIIPK